MPDWNKFDEMWKKMEPVRKVFGLLKHRAVPVFEDCLNYQKTSNALQGQTNEF